MLMELLYQNASSRPGRRGARLPRRARHARGAGGPGRAPGRRAGRRGHRRRRRRRPAAAQRPDLRGELLRDLGPRRDRRAGQPRLQAGRAGVLLPPVRGQGGDQRRPQRGRLRAHRGRLGRARQGDPHQRRPRAGAHARHADADRAGQARPSARPEEPLVYMFSSGSTGRPKRVARTHGQLRGEAEYYDWMGITARRTRSSARSPCSTPTAWAAAWSRPRAPARRS